jgi:hypothetical protein
MNHNTFVHNSLNPFINTLRNYFKNDSKTIEKINKMYQNEIINLSKIKPTNNINEKYLEILHKFIKIKNNKLHNENITLLKSELNKNNTNNNLYFPRKTSKYKSISKNRKTPKLYKLNLTQLMKTNWNSSLKS